MLTTHGSRLTRAAVAATSSAASFISASQPSRVSACKALHQRRPSSSKASCPPDNSHKGTRSAAAAPATASTSKQSPQSVRPASSGRSSTPRQTRAKKARDGSWVGVRNQKDQSSTAFKDLPRVASTNNIRPIGEYCRLLALMTELTRARYNTFLLLLPPPTHQSRQTFTPSSLDGGLRAHLSTRIRGRE